MSRKTLKQGKTPESGSTDYSFKDIYKKAKNMNPRLVACSSVTGHYR